MQDQDKTEKVVFGDEERPFAEEYHFDYVKARPNRFAESFRRCVRCGISTRGA